MSDLDAALVRWVSAKLPRGASLVEARGLRDGGSPWLLDLEGGSVPELVLRVGMDDDPGEIGTETSALRLASKHGIPVPEVVAVRDDEAPSLLLVNAVIGTSAIPPIPVPARLRALGAIAARLHAIPVPAWGIRREHPIAGVDFDEIRRAAAPVDVMERAAAVVDAVRRDPAMLSPEPDGFVHGDLWQGNTLWSGDELVAVIDWDCAGFGSAGIDLGSLRCDAALAHGQDAAADVLAGWESVAGRAAANVAYWDLVTGLSSPPDMGWFTAATSAQGRPDLTRELMVDRRNAFLEDALRRI